MKYAVFLYVIVSFAWIILTDLYVDKLPVPSHIAPYVQTLKGSLFVVLSAVFMYIALKKHRALKQMSEREQELLTLIHAMPDFVSFKDGQGRWLRVNEFGLKLYGLEHVDYKGKTDAELAEYTPHFREALLYCIDSDEEAWRAKTVTRADESFPMPNGEMKTFDVIKVPLFYENGKRKGLVVIGRDITQQKVAEQLLLKKEKLSVIGELAAGIAHEIRNPLTSIKGFLQMMKETKQVDERFVQIMLDEIERVNQIVTQLLVLAKPQMKAYKPLHLNDVIDYVIELFTYEAILQNVQIKYEPRTTAIVYGDKNELIQVVVNVVKNALEAMPKGGVLTITTEDEDDRVHLVIEDTGKGIEQERLKHIGEPFYTLKEKGMGLGLTTSMKIVHEHKGTMHIESKVGEGTKVHIVLPLHKNDPS
ncbi:signal transduction histidine kinase, nitrogen specific, contains PAS/PAC domain [Anoxybacillus flavithermus TNO-09.006]|uniref:histidine kinase n=1 Tax=Anoxybacillus flavithermus TaxID=33934 RepID=A0A178T944_9BACL|nr:ATP-binding protein [Anoxybacillus flavithermus]ASA96411.1 PAS domain-containing sensor histidine kinase [Anoxybacillus flavithermus]ELK21507.1 signal transduction histidine kinase, nitrogen specific, contains PAS/PAC domain [Anoxybacillus flavithermus TNO-09.006]MBE2907562.1 PAS domain-containing protein [Anoxybacillus flavithermus]MBE2929203.1 PAS domain-containing protein [Anoxybacillus flavithermus]MBE2931863.1 PAS domain-containing protein [Anoxybacillus flavithermus]